MCLQRRRACNLYPVALPLPVSSLYSSRRGIDAEKGDRLSATRRRLRRWSSSTVSSVRGRTCGFGFFFFFVNSFLSSPVSTIFYFFLFFASHHHTPPFAPLPPTRKTGPPSVSASSATFRAKRLKRPWLLRSTPISRNGRRAGLAQSSAGAPAAAVTSSPIFFFFAGPKNARCLSFPAYV